MHNVVQNAVILKREELALLKQKRATLKKCYDDQLSSSRAQIIELQKTWEERPEFVKLKQMEMMVLKLKVSQIEANKIIEDMEIKKKEFNAIQKERFTADIIQLAEAVMQFQKNVQMSKELAEIKQKQKTLQKKLDELTLLKSKILYLHIFPT